MFISKWVAYACDLCLFELRDPFNFAIISNKQQTFSDWLPMDQVVRSSIARKIAGQQLKKYGHLLKWKSYKERWLDLGCGEGVVTRQVLYPYIKDHIEKLTSVDKQDNLIQLANKHNSADKIDYKVLDIMDAEAIAKMHNKFDRVFSSLVCHMIPNTRALLSNLHTILKPEGQIFIITLIDTYFERGLDQEYKEEKWLKFKPQQHIFADYSSNPVIHLKELLHTTDFKIDTCKYEEVSFTSDNFKGLILNLCNMYRNLMPPSEELSKQFIEGVIEKCRAECTYLGIPERYAIPHRLLTCVATK